MSGPRGARLAALLCIPGFGVDCDAVIAMWCRLVALPFDAGFVGECTRGTSGLKNGDSAAKVVENQMMIEVIILFIPQYLKTLWGL